MGYVKLDTASIMFQWSCTCRFNFKSIRRRQVLFLCPCNFGAKPKFEPKILRHISGVKRAIFKVFTCVPTKSRSRNTMVMSDDRKSQPFSRKRHFLLRSKLDVQAGVGECRGAASCSRLTAEFQIISALFAISRERRGLPGEAAGGGMST